MACQPSSERCNGQSRRSVHASYGSQLVGDALVVPLRSSGGDRGSTLLIRTAPEGCARAVSLVSKEIDLVDLGDMQSVVTGSDVSGVRPAGWWLPGVGGEVAAATATAVTYCLSCAADLLPPRPTLKREHDLHG